MNMLDATEVRSWAQYRMWVQSGSMEVSRVFSPPLVPAAGGLLLYRNVCDQESDGPSLPTPGTGWVHCGHMIAL